MPMVGVPSAAAMCIRPESLEIATLAAAMARMPLRKSVPVRSRTVGPPTATISAASAFSAGPIKTASARGIKDFSKILDGVAAAAPLRRNTDPAEVADTAVFLASDLGRGVTGNVIFVDAGFQTIVLMAG